MSLVGFQRFQDFDGGGSVCPTITLGDLNWSESTNAPNEYFLTGGDPEYVNCYDIVGGLAPYNISSDDLPAGITIDYVTDTKIRFIGDGVTFGTKTFNLYGTDANGCAITPKEYTIEVRQQDVYTGPSDIDPGLNTYIIPVSGLNNPTITSQLVSVLTTLTHPATEELYGYIVNPDNAGTSDLFILNTIGADFDQMVIYNSAIQANPDLDTGSAPYTGNWSDAPGGLFNGNACAAGINPNGDWEYNILNSGATTGTLTTVTLLFKP